MNPFNGDYYDEDGVLRNLMGTPEPDTGRPNDSMSPFNGDFYAGDGSIHNITELSGGGGGGPTAISPNTIVSGIGDGKVLGVHNGKVNGVDISNLAVNLRTIELTLLNSAWIGTDPPYTQSITIQDITVDTIGILFLSHSANQAQAEAAYNALLRIVSQSTDLITVAADSVKPEIDIPVGITLLG